MMDGMTDEELQALIASGGDIASAEAKLAKAKQMAEMLRNATPELRGRHTGRTFVASNPLEVAANVFGAYKQKKNLDKQEGFDLEKQGAMTKQNQAVIAALLRKRNPQATGGAAFTKRPMPGEEDDDPSYGYASPL